MTSLVATRDTTQGAVVLAEKQQVRATVPSIFIAPPDKLKELRTLYGHIYKWHSTNGKSVDQAKFVDQDEAEAYAQILANLKSEQVATLNEMFTIAAEVWKGAMNWSSWEVENGKHLKWWAHDIILLGRSYGAQTLKEFRKRMADQKAKFQDAATAFFFENVPKLKEVFDTGLDEKFIGGLTVLMETNAMYNRGLIVTPSLLHFEGIPEDDALVNLAIAGKVEVTKVRLERDSTIWIKFKNLTDEDISFFIPRGQLFENDKFECKYQNLMLLREQRGVLKAGTEQAFTGYATCINGYYAPPKGTRGKLAIFKYDKYNKAFENEREVWNSMDEHAFAYGSWKERLRNAFNFSSSWHQLNRTKQKVAIGLGTIIAVVGGSLLFAGMM